MNQQNTAEHTLSWLHENDVHVLDWPIHSLDLNIIENVWSQVVRDVYRDGKGCENREQFEDAVIAVFENSSLKYIQSMCNSIHRRFMSVNLIKKTLLIF